MCAALWDTRSLVFQEPTDGYEWHLFLLQLWALGLDHILHSKGCADSGLSSSGVASQTEQALFLQDQVAT